MFIEDIKDWIQIGGHVLASCLHLPGGGGVIAHVIIVSAPVKLNRFLIQTWSSLRVHPFVVGWWLM